MTRFEENMNYFKSVVNTVFTEEPKEDELISLKELFEAHSKTPGQDPNDIDYKHYFDGVMRYIVATVPIHSSIQVNAKGEPLFFKKDLWEVANKVYYWEKPGYIG